jgi:hypothetical protein
MICALLLRVRPPAAAQPVRPAAGRLRAPRAQPYLGVPPPAAGDGGAVREAEDYLARVEKPLRWRITFHGRDCFERRAHDDRQLALAR